MATTKTTGLTCMNCGAAITSGFFCAKCEAIAVGSDPGEPKSGKPQTYFHGSAGSRKKRDLLMENMIRWAKVAIILAIIGGGGYFVYANWGDDARAAYDRMNNPKEKYDPTKDAQVVEGDEAGKTGKRAFSTADTKGL
jgi:hypothetical protein